MAQVITNSGHDDMIVGVPSQVNSTCKLRRIFVLFLEDS